MGRTISQDWFQGRDIMQASLFTVNRNSRKRADEFCEKCSQLSTKEKKNAAIEMVFLIGILSQSFSLFMNQY